MAAFSQGSTFCVSQGRGESRQCLQHEEHESNQVKESSLSMLHPSYTDFKLWMNPNRGSAWVTSYSLVRTRSSRTHPWCWRQPVPAREAPATARTTAHHLPAAAAAAFQLVRQVGPTTSPTHGLAGPPVNRSERHGAARSVTPPPASPS